MQDTSSTEGLPQSQSDEQPVPRLPMTTASDYHDANSGLPRAISRHTSIPENLAFHKTRQPVVNFNGGADLETLAPPRKFAIDGVTTPRSTSGPPMSRLNLNQTAAVAASRAHNASFKDLVAKFNTSNDEERGAARARYTRLPSATALSSSYRPHTSPRPRGPRTSSAPRPGAGRRPSGALTQNGYSGHLERVNAEHFNLSIPPFSNHHQLSPEGSPTSLEPDYSPTELLNRPALGELSPGMSPWFRPGYNIPIGPQRRGSEGVEPLQTSKYSPRRTSDFLPSIGGGISMNGQRKLSADAPMQRSMSDFSGVSSGNSHSGVSMPARSSRNGVPSTVEEVSLNSPARTRIPIRSSSQTPLNGSPRSAKRTRIDTVGPSIDIRFSRSSRRSITPPGRLFPVDFNGSPTRAGANGPRIKAKITAPGLGVQLSPPLRSSRPRQYVSSARSASPSSTRVPLRNVPSFNSLSSSAPYASDSLHIISEKQNLLTQISNAASQNTPPRLTLNVEGFSKKLSGEPLTASTEFEEDFSPMPGSFPEDKLSSPPGSAHVHLVSQTQAEVGEGGQIHERTADISRMEHGALGAEDTTQSVLDRIMELREKSSALLSGVLGASLTTVFPTVVSPASEPTTREVDGTTDVTQSDNPIVEHRSGGWQSRTIQTRRSSSTTPSRASASVRGNSDFLSPSKLSPSKSGLDWTASGLTLDSDAYSVINRVLDQYHETGTVSPEMVHVFQKQIMETDPELAARSEVDSLSIAKAALEDFVRDHSSSNLTGKPSQLSLLQSSSQPNLFTFDERCDAEQLFSIRDQPTRSTNATRAFAEMHHSTSLSHLQHANVNLSRDNQSLPEHQLSTTIRLKRQSNAGQLVPQHQPFEYDDNQEDDIGPTPPPKDYKCQTLPKVERKLFHDRAPPAERIAGQSTHTAPRALTATKQPLLPEIPSTGGLGFLITPRQSAETPIVQRSSNTGQQSPPSSYTAVANARSRSPSASLRSRGYSATASTPTSDTARPFGHSPSDPPRTERDTPASSIQNSASLDSGEHPSVSASNEPLVTIAAPQTADQRRLTKRKHTIKELVDTEFSFNQDMKVIEDIYKGTASAVEALTADDRRILFGNSAQIVEFSEAFLDTLKQAALSVYVMPRTNKWRIKRGSISGSTTEQDEQTIAGAPEMTDDEKDRKTFIGEAFGQHMAEMEKVYGDYLRNHDLANQRLSKLQNVPQVSLWLNECHTYASDITSAWNLDSLIVKPVQRILKYPLLLKSLLEETPTDHSDYSALEIAVKQMMDVTARINESKKRAELLDAVVNRPNKRKDYDVSTALSKAFGRRTDKLKQQVGLSDAVEDPEYKAISEKFGGQFFQLQVVMRDMEMYKKATEDFIRQLNKYIEVTEEMLTLGPHNSPDIEAKWRKFGSVIREVTAVTFVDHEATIRKDCIDPMATLLKLHEAPQRLMQKRKKRIVEYARYLTLKNAGNKLDKKTQEQGEQFVALNETLKDELPKLFSLTAKLVQACLRNYIDIQAQWHATWQRKIKRTLQEEQIPKDLSDIIEAFQRDFQPREEQVLSLSVCNGSALASLSSFTGSSATTMIGTDDSLSLKRPSIRSANSNVTVQGSDTQSPVLPQPDFVTKRRSNGSSSFAMPSFSSPRSSAEANRRSQSSIQLSLTASAQSPRRLRAGSSTSAGASSSNPARTPPIPQRTSSSQTIAYGPYSATARPTAPINLSRPPTSSRNHSSAANARSSASSAQSIIPTTTSTVAALARMSPSTLHGNSAAPPSSYPSSNPASPNLSSPRFSEVFNSALPTSAYSSQPNTPPLLASVSMSLAQAGSIRHVAEPAMLMARAGGGARDLGNGENTNGRQKTARYTEYRVLFLAASLFEFNIDRSRKEAGYPYLTYVPGEVFDVIGEKGELWLARNQDDGSGLVGWIWEKHFAKLMPETGR